MSLMSRAGMVTILAAVIGGLVGSWYGGYLSREQWKYQRTLEAYSSLLRILDDALIESASLPGEFELVDGLNKSGRQSEAWEIIRRVNQAKTEFPRIVARARTSITDIQALHPSRLEEASAWLELINESVVPLVGFSIQAAHGDTAAHRRAQVSIEDVRRGVRLAQGEDLRIVEKAGFWRYFPKFPISLSVVGLSLDILGAIILTFGELRSLSARIRQHTGPIQTTLVQRVPAALAGRFGSTRGVDTMDFAVEVLNSRFWGLSFLVVGFVLQLLGASGQM